MPVYDRLYLGGASNLRGFGFRKVGPLDYKGNPVGGRTLVRYTAEYTYPVINRVRGAFFTDGGYVNQDDFDFEPRDYHERSDFRFDPNKIDNDPKTPRPNPTGNDSRTRFSAAVSTRTSAWACDWTCRLARCGLITAIRWTATRSTNVPAANSTSTSAINFERTPEPAV